MPLAPPNFGSFKGAGGGAGRRGPAPLPHSRSRHSRHNGATCESPQAVVVGVTPAFLLDVDEATPKAPGPPPTTPAAASESDLIAVAKATALAAGAKLPAMAAAVKAAARPALSRTHSNLSKVSKSSRGGGLTDGLTDDEGIPREGPTKSILRAKSQMSVVEVFASMGNRSEGGQSLLTKANRRGNKRRVTLGKAEVREYRVQLSRSVSF